MYIWGEIAGFYDCSLRLPPFPKAKQAMLFLGPYAYEITAQLYEIWEHTQISTQFNRPSVIYPKCANISFLFPFSCPYRTLKLKSFFKTDMV